MELTDMAIPVYLFLKDDGGALIKGSSDVKDREMSVEVLAFGHGLHLPTDNNTGKITGTRVHSAITFEKEFDSSSPYLYKAVAKGQSHQRCRAGSRILQHAAGEREGSICFPGDVRHQKPGDRET